MEKQIEERLTNLEYQLTATQYALWAVIAASDNPVRVFTLVKKALDDLTNAGLFGATDDAAIEAMQRASALILQNGLTPR